MMKRLLLVFFLAYFVQTFAGTAFDMTVLEAQTTSISQKQPITHSFNSFNKTLIVKSDLKLHSISVYNVLGLETLTKKLNSFESKINLSSLNKGIYIAKIRSVDNTVKTIKLVIK
jgi:hypothetical protein